MEHQAETAVDNFVRTEVPNQLSTRAGPFTPALVCDCGRPNPDSCPLPNQTESPPYVHSSSDQAFMRSALQEEGLVPLTETQAYLRQRSGPPHT